MQTSPFSLLAALSLLTIARGFDARSNNTLAEAYIPPGPPQGARIVNFKPSKLTRASVPVFANSLFVTKGISNAKRGIVGLTGKGRDGSQTFPDLYQVVADDFALAVPNFYEARDRGKATTDGFHASYLNATRHMVWPEGTEGSWVTGDDASDGGLGDAYDLAGAQISSFDVVDKLVRLYSDKSIYPDMQDIVVAGHSAGGKMTVSYSYTSEETPTNGIAIRYVHLNAPSSIFSESHRPLSTSLCSTYRSWPYGPQGTQPRYVSSRRSEATFARWVSRDVVRVIGNADTIAQTGSNCGATVQGGDDRLSRNYGAWVYENMLAGTDTDLSNFESYEELKESGLKSQSVGTFRKRLAVVDGVGHDSTKMFASKIGKQAILDEHIDQGPLPSRA